MARTAPAGQLWRQPTSPEDYALTFRAQTSIASAFDVMLDAEHIEVGTSPGWVERFQGFTDWLGAQPRDNRRLRHSRTDAFFLSDILNEVAAECPRAGITADEMSDWTLNHSSDDISVMPSLGLFREAMREKLLNPGTRWEDNDLADLMYLTCGAGYADHVVAERSFASQIDRAVRRLGRTPNVHRNLCRAARRAVKPTVMSRLPACSPRQRGAAGGDPYRMPDLRGARVSPIAGCATFPPSSSGTSGMGRSSSQLAVEVCLSPSYARDFAASVIACSTSAAR